MIDRKAFFEACRGMPFLLSAGKLTQTTVEGINAILDAWDASGLTDKRWLAYMLATAVGETGKNMQPVREGFKDTDAQARAYVSSRGYKYAKEVNGHVYYGRGLVQLTWDDNYEKMGAILGVPLVSDPDLALRPDIASRIMFEGMQRGTFTGKRLSNYFGPTTTDWKNARRIINGTDRADEIGEYGRHFYAALTAAAVPASAQEPQPAPLDIEDRFRAIEARLKALEAARA
jgi:putative chitinase